MAEKKKNLSEHQSFTFKSGKKYNIGIVVSEWNPEVTDSLCHGATELLINQGIPKKNIIIKKVPGSYELPLGAQLLIEEKEVDAVICLGCVIQGETRHFEFICHAVSQNILRLNLDYKTPVIFGVLTTDTMEQALARSGGKHGNKGIEAAVAALKMIQLSESLRK